MQKFWYHSPVRFYRTIEELEDMTNPQNTQYFGDVINPYPLEIGEYHRFLIPMIDNDVPSDDLELWIGDVQISAKFHVVADKLERVTFMHGEHLSGRFEIRHDGETLFYSNCIKFIDSSDGTGRKFIRIATKHYYNKALFNFEDENNWIVTNIPAYCLGQFRVDAEISNYRAGGNSTLKSKESHLDEIVSYEFLTHGDANILAFLQVHSTNTEFYIDGTKRTLTERITVDDLGVNGVVNFTNQKNDIGLNITMDYTDPLMEKTPMQPFSMTVDTNGNADSFSAINNLAATESGRIHTIMGNFPEVGVVEFFIAKNKSGSASPYNFKVGRTFSLNVTQVGLNTFNVSSLGVNIKKGEYLGVSKNSTSKPYYGIDASFQGWYQTSDDIATDLFIDTPYIPDATFSVGFSIQYSIVVTTTKLTAVQNPENYNSIRNLIDSITDSSDINQYEIFIPNGTWNEVDWQGKKGVKIIGESRDGTIIKLDPQGAMATEIAPANYSFPTEAGKNLSNVNVNYMHIIYATDDIHCENLTFDTKNSKYAIHLDNPAYTRATFINCRIKEEFSNYPIGMGIFGGQNILFDKCIIQPLTMWRGFFYHNWNNQSEANTCAFNECLFINCNYAMIDELGSEQDDWVNITNCTSTLGAAGIDFMVDMNGSGDTFWINPATSLNEPNPVNVPYNIHIDASGTLVGTLTSADSGSFNPAWTGTPQRDISIIQSISIGL